jgi:hypothetical protein
MGCLDDREQTEKDVEGSGDGLIYGAIPAFARNERRKPRRRPVRIVGIPAEIRTWYLPNTSQKRYRLSQVALCPPCQNCL